MNTNRRPTRKIGHGHVRYVGPVGGAYFFFCLFAAFCGISIVVGIIYIAWPYILGAIAVALIMIYRDKIFPR